MREKSTAASKDSNPPDPLCRESADTLGIGYAALVPLSVIKPGEHARLRRIEAGCELQTRLASMGLLPGTEVRVVLNDTQGPMVVGVKDVRLMLGRGMVDKIFVHRVKPGVRLASKNKVPEASEA